MLPVQSVHVRGAVMQLRGGLRMVLVVGFVVRRVDITDTSYRPFSWEHEVGHSHA